VLKTRAICCVVAVLSLTTSACGGSSSTQAPTPPPTNPNLITIGANGIATPKELTVAPGSRVLFVNNDTRRHYMSSDPHPEHDDCPAFDQVGVLLNGQSRETGNLITVRTCGFHDHENPDNANLKGRIIVR
jgi:plastocyanin